MTILLDINWIGSVNFIRYVISLESDPLFERRGEDLVNHPIEQFLLVGRKVCLMYILFFLRVSYVRVLISEYLDLVRIWNFMKIVLPCLGMNTSRQNSWNSESLLGMSVSLEMGGRFSEMGAVKEQSSQGLNPAMRFANISRMLMVLVLFFSL